MHPIETGPPASHHKPAVSPERVRATVRDRRPFPQGALPRQLQTWIMVGLAVLILAVIIMTGRPEPGPMTPVTPAATVASGPIPPARVQSYQERLAEQEARLVQDARLAQETGPSAAVAAPSVSVVPSAMPLDPLADERRRREEQSLFADNMAFTRRGGTVAALPATRDARASPAGAGYPDDSPTTELPASDPVEANGDRGPEGDDPRSRDGDRLPSPGVMTGHLETLPEGTLIETVLVNRLDGTFQGPIQCIVTTPVYSLDRQAVVIPAGARVVGTAAAIQAWGESRLSVRFHRLLMPDGRSHSLDSFPGLNQVGETGLKDSVDRHYLQVFGASVAIGAVAGLAQVGTRGGFDPSFSDAARQAVGGSLATSTARVLDRYLNVLPTVTIREGHRIKVVLTRDVRLPVYGPALTAQGGV